MAPHRRWASQIGPVFSLGRNPSTHSRTAACSHTAIRCTSMPFYLLHKIWFIVLFGVFFCASFPVAPRSLALLRYILLPSVHWS